MSKYLYPNTSIRVHGCIHSPVHQRTWKGQKRQEREVQEADFENNQTIKQFYLTFLLAQIELFNC